jgi:hypothetical protein
MCIEGGSIDHAQLMRRWASCSKCRFNLPCIPSSWKWRKKFVKVSFSAPPPHYLVVSYYLPALYCSRPHMPCVRGDPPLRSFMKKPGRRFRTCIVAKSCAMHASNMMLLPTYLPRRTNPCDRYPDATISSILFRLRK